MRNTRTTGSNFDDEPVKANTFYFNHLYHKSGFDVSKEVASNGKEYIAPSIHSCLRHGYWCWKNAIERPLDILKYITHLRTTE